MKDEEGYTHVFRAWLNPGFTLSVFAFVHVIGMGSDWYGK